MSRGAIFIPFEAAMWRLCGGYVAVVRV